MTVPARLMKDQPRSQVARRTLPADGHVVGGQLHDEGSGVTGERLGLFQDDAGDDDGRHADEVGGGGHPGRCRRTGRRRTGR